VKRFWATAAFGGATLFASTDLALNAFATWLAQNDFIATSVVVNELFLRFVPFMLAGLTAGYVALPRGFSAAAFGGLAGAAISLAFRYNEIVDWAAAAHYNTAAMFSWGAGIAIASGVCGWAGEWLRTKGGLRPNTSFERTREG
jgi:hypothetical protein